MILAQLTDLHITPRGNRAYRVVDTEACLRAAVAAVAALNPAPDAILITGDLTDAGLPEEYELLREILAPLRPPLFVLPGNHDDRAALRAGFADHDLPGSGADPIHYTVEAFPVRLVILDSVIPGSGGGRLGPDQIAWLDRSLADQPDRPTVVAFHHPPFLTGIRHMDQIGLADADSLATVIRRHPQVERVLGGHIHRPIQTRWAGTLASVAPSTAHQVALDLRPDGEPAFHLEPAGYQLHLWTAATGLVSHTATVGTWPGPFPFFKEGRLIPSKPGSTAA
jgi:3',5'-cyclic AMP phosphodiesterase CpdA